ncbi:hypothetical protein DES37_11039 [Mangrovibacter plantisponsor]|uniref:Uncharacterized protein n=1 Tax=Mangrovibacter plantisponsor TaxID=451513 RepID=A0A317PV67_9ENTR|nr:hypothetical protein DES37_11039 [Mangrovibacter plantisponsor]
MVLRGATYLIAALKRFRGIEYNRVGLCVIAPGDLVPALCCHHFNRGGCKVARSCVVRPGGTLASCQEQADGQ